MTREAPAAAASVGEALRGCPLPEAEKRALLARALGVAREHLIAHPEAGVDAAALARFRSWALERQGGTPLAYLLGAREFHGLDFRVTPDVLIPRPETELLVERTTEALRGRAAARVLELGTGSGCVAIALAVHHPGWLVVATDNSPAALRVARQNSRRLGAAVHFVAGDWLEPLRGRFDLIVSNPPYVASGDPHLVALAGEPRAALAAGSDGLAALRAIVAGARRCLLPDGRLLVEHGYDQGAAVRELLQRHGYGGVRTHRDLEGRERVGEGALGEVAARS